MLRAITSLVFLELLKVWSHTIRSLAQTLGSTPSAASFHSLRTWQSTWSWSEILSSTSAYSFWSAVNVSWSYQIWTHCDIVHPNCIKNHYLLCCTEIKVNSILKIPSKCQKRMIRSSVKDVKEYTICIDKTFRKVLIRFIFTSMVKKCWHLTFLYIRISQTFFKF